MKSYGCKPPWSVAPRRRSLSHVLHHKHDQHRLSGALEPPLNLAMRWPSDPIRLPTCSQGAGWPVAVEGRVSTANDPQCSHRPWAVSSTVQTFSPRIFTWGSRDIKRLRLARSAFFLHQSMRCETVVRSK